MTVAPSISTEMSFLDAGQFRFQDIFVAGFGDVDVHARKVVRARPDRPQQRLEDIGERIEGQGLY